MRAIAVLFAGLVALSSLALADAKNDWSDCAGDNSDRAVAACTRIITQGKESRANLALAYGHRGRCYVNKREYDKAIADLDEATRLDPKSDFAYYNRALAHHEKGADDQAIADFGKYIGLKPDDPGGYKARAESYATKGDQERAIADYSEAIKRKADYADAYYGRGTSYFSNKDYDRSLADCEHAITLKPDHAEAYACRGDAFTGKDDYDAAVASFDKAIEIAGKDAWAGIYRARADALSNKGEFDQSIASYDEALRLDPKDAEARENRGLTLCNKGDQDRGLADLDQALQLNADNAKGIYNSKAWCLLLKGELDKALAEAERAVAATPDDAGAIDTRGEVYLRKGLLDLALADFDKAASLDATLIEVYRDRGLLFEQKGDRARALAEFRQALALKPRWVMERRAQDEALARLTALTTAATPVAAPADDSVTPPEPRAPEKRIALVIGNEAYTNVRALKNADSDARAVSAALRRLGFEVIEKHDLMLTELIAELKAFGDRAPQFDWAVVYYAGHGIEIGGTNYLIPVDAELSAASHVDDEAFPLDRVLAKVEGAQKLRLVILDACRENPFIAKMASAGGTRSVGRGLARIEPDDGVLVAYSAKDGQVAQDGDGANSPFAQALLDHVDEPGLEINMLFRKVRDDVKKRTNGEQTPFTYGSLPAETLYFKAAGQ